MAEQRGLEGLWGAFDRLSSREKVMVGGLVGAVLLALIAATWIVVGNQIADLREHNELQREELTKVLKRKDAFLARKAKLDADEKLLDKNTVRLVNLMERTAQRLGVTIENFREGRRPLTENYRKNKKRAAKAKSKGKGKPLGKPLKDLVEESQTVTMRKISLENLVRLLDGLESNRNPIRVTKLNISALQSDRQILREVRMTAATYRKAVWEN